MNPSDLTRIGPGFSSPVGGSQKVFRAALEALSRPGRIQSVVADATVPDTLHAASNALLLALLDQDTRLWLAPACAEAGAYLRFHTGCSLESDPGRADFALCGARELPALESLAQGSDDYPDRSATLVVQVDSLEERPGWKLAGPGIKGSQKILVAGLDGAFLAQWKRNRAQFPRGVDVFLACADRLAGLPRTTDIEA